MNYPLISEYVEAIKLAEDNLEQLSFLRPVLDDEGIPVMSSGNFAVVFKMKDERNGKLHALKCFIKDQEGRDEAYKQIADELEFVSSEFIIPIKFFEKELFVATSNSDETEFPVLLMDWVEGVTLDKYVRAHLQDQYSLQLISYQFCRVAAWLMAQPFAHGDLKPDNIIVKDDGSLVLVDYDGMFVPAMKGQKAREIGSPDYRHPARTIDDFNEHIDDFSLATIAMQLYAISLQPELLQTSPEDTLLLCEKDYRDMGESEIMTKLFSQVGNPEFEKLLSIFMLAHSEMFLSLLSFRAFNISKPVKPIQIDLLSTKVEWEEISKGVKDESGAIYSHDGKRLLKGPDSIQSYQIKHGTTVICDDAFGWLSGLRSVIIPNTVKIIGDGAFRCHDLLSIEIPESVQFLVANPFYRGIKSIVCHSPHFIVDNNVLYSRDKHRLIAFFGKYKQFDIPNSVINIEKRAFWNCEGQLTSVTIPNSVISIGNQAFGNCWGLTSITIPNSVTTIGDSAFRLCSGLTSVAIGRSVTAIGDGAFDMCDRLTKITIPDSVTSIGSYAFHDCRNLTNATIGNSVTAIGNEAFWDCKSLTSITIPNSVSSIGLRAFKGCIGLTSISIPSSITNIGNGAFSGCDELVDITVEKGNQFYDSRNNCNAIIETSSNTLIAGCKNTVIPYSVTSIGKHAFDNCKGLTSITIPNSVTYIGKGAFSGCGGLTSLTIPNSVTNIDEVAFFGCVSLSSIIIQSSITNISKYAFPVFDSLTRIYIPKGTREHYNNQPEPYYKDKLIEI